MERTVYLSLVLLSILALHQTEAFLKLPKLKLLKFPDLFDLEEKDKDADESGDGEDKLFKMPKLFKGNKFDKLFKPFEELFEKDEEKKEKIKDDFDEKILDLFKDKDKMKKIFDDFVDKKSKEEEAVKYPVKDKYESYPKKSKDNIHKIKYVGAEDEEDEDHGYRYKAEDHGYRYEAEDHGYRYEAEEECYEDDDTGMT